MAVAMLLVPTVSAYRYRRGIEPFEATFQLRNPASTPYPGGNTLPTSTNSLAPGAHGLMLKIQRIQIQACSGLSAWGTIKAVTMHRKVTLNQRYWLSVYETGVRYVLANPINILDGTVNTKTGEAVFHYLVIWTFEGGSFEGVMQSRLESYPQPYEYYEIHCILKGTDAFKGQTLHLSYEGSTIAPVWNGYLLNAMN